MAGMEQNPLVSVVMPVYNAEKYVDAALQSVFGQTYKNLEVICVYDKSTDKSLDRLKSYGDKIHLRENGEKLGIGGARNNGIEIAQGAFLAFMDADDIWEPQKIERQIEQFIKDPTLDVSFTYMQCFLSEDIPEEVKKIRYCNPDPMPGYLAAAAVVKTTSFHKVGLFNPKWRVGEFVDWSKRAKELHLKMDIIPETLLRRRIHETNTGVTERPSRNDYITIMRESLQRKKNKDKEHDS